MDVAEWLSGLELGQYVDAFATHDIDAETLVRLTGEDLKEIGVNSVGHRRRLLDAIAALDMENAAPARLSETLAGAPGSDAERRQLTVMFCDLVGSTALAERLDPEDIREIIGAYQNAAATEIRQFDGHVARFMGDGVLAYFGWPAAHEDDAERAVRSSLNIIEAIGQITTPDEEALEVRVGIATGLVVVGDLIGEGAAEEEAVVGGTPNLAARLQALAESNTVVIADGTRALLGERFACEDLGLHDLRGFSQPVQAWRVIRRVRAESRFESTRGPQLTPLVGREEELDLLRRRWATVKEGGGQVVLLTGEAGIGKSRIVHTLHQEIAAAPYVRLFYQCSPYNTNSALYPFIRQLERAAGFELGDTDDERLDKLEAVLGQSTDRVQEVAALFAALLSIDGGPRYPPLTMSPHQQKERTLSVLVAQLEGLAAQQPVLVVFEDAHWMDPSSQELLDLIVERVQEIPVLVLITYRPEFAPPWTGQAHVSLLALSRLNRDLGAAMVRELSGRKELPQEVLEQIVVKTDGIPLFVEELTKTVLASGLLEEQQDRYAVIGQLPAHAIPTSLKDSLMARLDRLAPAKEVAQIGAVIGREFSYELLAEVSDLSEVDLGEALDRLSLSELIFSRGAPPNANYLFKHALIQDAAYESLLKSRRQQLHARIAQIIEEQFPERAEVEPELLAHHHTEAGLAEQAVPYWQRAGERAVAQSAYVEAIGHLKHGMTVLNNLPEGPERTRHELQLQSTMGPPLIATKGYGASEVEQVYTRAHEVWRQVGNTAQLGPILYGLWTYFSTRANHQRARALRTELLEVAEIVQDPALLLDAHVASACTSYFTGEFDLAREHGYRGATLFDAQRHRSHALQNPGVVCRTVNATALWCLGAPDQALTSSYETLSLARELSHPFSLAVTLTWFAMLHQYRGEAREARDLAEEAMAISTEQSFPNWYATAAMVYGWALAELGRQEEGGEQVRESVALANDIGTLIWRPYQLSLLAEVHVKAGYGNEAMQLLSEAYTVAKETGERYWESELHRRRGELRLSDATGDPADAEDCFNQALEVARCQQAKSLELRAATSLSRLWQDRGRRSEARDLLDPIYGWFTEGYDTADLKEAKALLDALTVEGNS